MNHRLTREEVLWWYTPELRRRREWFQKYLARGGDWCDWEWEWEERGEDPKDPSTWRGSYTIRNCSDWWDSRFHHVYRKDNHFFGPVSELPVLLYKNSTWSLKYMHQVDACGFFNFEKGWRFNHSYLSDETNWDGHKLKLNAAIIGPNDPSLNTLERVMWVLNDPRTVDLDSIPEADDTKRLVRLIQTTYQRFVVDEVPSVPSLWKEDSRVLCGWNDLFQFDGRELHPGAYEAKEWDGVEYWQTQDWRWKVPKTRT